MELNRKLLRLDAEAAAALRNFSSASIEDSTYPIPRHANCSPTLSRRHVNTPNNVSTPLDSSVALTVLVLLAVLFFLGFLSVYICRLANNDNGISSVRRLRHHPSPPLWSYPRSPPRKGLDTVIIDALPRVIYGGGRDGKQQTEDCCAICLGEFEESESVKLIPFCQHVFHLSCLDTWLSSHVSCPLCRSTQFNPKVDDAERETAIAV